ncbi:hypothetical protein FA15DRAFT_281000 [Coprinopsis marcescibilis]|uniref:Uncharacterized protein n=1 Tax=Coprinopsis marcescibilis TaxID=230819 RepID=A0A5C3KDQ8_COPMA|nr:hypothetical protein FA15DRAFT_281000 [Coprinopsis marcescibilis]
MILRTWKPPRRLSSTVTLLLPYVLHVILVLSANIPPRSLYHLWTSSQTRYSAHRSPAHPSLSDHRTSTIHQPADDFSDPGTRSETKQRDLKHTSQGSILSLDRDIGNGYTEAFLFGCRGTYD